MLGPPHEWFIVWKKPLLLRRRSQITSQQRGNIRLPIGIDGEKWSTVAETLDLQVEEVGVWTFRLEVKRLTIAIRATLNP